MFFKIYKTTNLINGKIYIGQTHYDRHDYFGSGVLLKEAIEKYGVDNFVKEYIDEASSQEELDAKEMFWIKELNSQNREIGYNIADGGWNYFTMSDEVKEKISNTLKGKYVGNAAFRKGIPLSEEHKNLLSVAMTGRKLSQETKDKLSNAHKGKKLSQKTKDKLSNAHKGKKLSEEHKKKISEGGKGREYTDDQKERLRQSNINKTQKHSRTIYAKCIKTDKELNFNNTSEAARYFNVTRHRIMKNQIEGWEIVVNNPIVSIKQLKNTTNESESTGNT
jgi:group I intron endonuclease